MNVVDFGEEGDSYVKTSLSHLVNSVILLSNGESKSHNCTILSTKGPLAEFQDVIAGDDEA